MKNLKAYKIQNCDKRLIFSAEGHSFKAKRAGFLYQNEISSVIHDFRRDWSPPGLLCELFLPAIPTSQGYISNVFTVSQCSQRNSWDIRKELRLSRLFFCFNLHRPGVHQWSLQCLKVSAKECVINSVQLQGKVWDHTQLSSQARDTSIESFLFQSVCNFSSP